MQYFFYFGHNGWTAKFVDIFRHLKELDSDIKMSGVVFGTFEQFSESLARFNLDVDYSISEQDVLIRDILAKPLDLAKADQYERQYGNLWTFINSERRFVNYLYTRKFQRKEYSHEELLKLVVGQFEYFEGALSNVDVLVTMPPASSWARVMCAVANNIGVTLVNIDQVGFPKDRATLTNSYFQRWSEVDCLFLEHGNSKEIYTWDEFSVAKSVINKYRKEKQDPPWAVQKHSRKQFMKWANWTKIKRYVARCVDRALGRDVLVPSAMLQAKQYIKMLAIDQYISKFFKFDKFIKSEDYYYYPLHVEPEASLMLSGQRALNQQSLIQRVATQLPAGCKLYVKEHPAMCGWRRPDYYKSLMKIPSVKVLEPSINNVDIILNAKAIFTVVGSTGWEAINFEKPVFIFGQAFYYNLPMARYIVDIDNIHSDIEWLHNSYFHDEDALIKFQACILKSSFPVPYSYFWGIVDDDDTVAKVAKQTNISKKIAEQIYKNTQISKSYSE